MTPTIDEMLSAAADGELSKAELEQLLADVEKAPALLESWRACHVTRSAIHAEPVCDVRIDVCDAVKARISALEPDAPEVSDTAPKRDNVVAISTRASFLRPLVSMGLAASLTAVVILGGQYVTSQNSAAHTAPSIALQPTAVLNQNLQRAQFGTAFAPELSTSTETPDIIRDQKALERYLSARDKQVHTSAPTWQVGWLPKGFQKVREQMNPNAESVLFSNGAQSISVIIAKAGREGVMRSNRTLALSKRQQNGQYVTVVGEMPLLVAEKIANSLTVKEQ